ncbi:TlpA family protein disulfide reductase [Roseimaritima ulvae]|uniref:Thiol-disulfide oxidoreductase ResA n=1 Tax=Roseimaritima ulvae TaxID=980254 RepID=A0A5B9QX86_9BACT|nr:TlpA disulfide reductase family protein [Roseimaritima ulvae]QEG42420.1 Thiol-disulfide oxidoreductase ResA [Roseimaritima ulvae]
MPRKAALLVVPLVVSLTPALQLFAAPPAPKAALGLKPVQDSVAYQLVPESQVESCKVRDLDGKWAGWEVTTADGTILRRFADTNRDKKVDLWCYFDQGVEVYRDVDSDFNGKADQYRWLGTAGTRWGMDEDEDGKIDAWKRISAEEVTAEVIGALAAGDAARFSRLLLSPEELSSLRLETEEAGKLGAQVKRAATEFAAFAKRQKQVGSGAQWVQFAAATPGVLPAGALGLTSDLVVYENAVAMFESRGESGQVVVGTLVQVGDAWRLIDLPQIVGDDMVARSSGYFFTPLRSTENAVPAGAEGEAAQKLVAQLEKIDQALSQAKASELPRLNAGRADVVEQLAAAASTPEDRQAWVQQLVDTVAAAVQEGTYPAGTERLKKISRGLGRNDQSLKSYVDFQVISSEYASRLRGSKSEDFPKIQEWYLESLTDFVSSYESTPEAGKAMLQLALSKEFEAKEDDALRWYRRVAKEFAGQPAGDKAAGAVTRLDSVGKRLDLRGTTIDGKNFQLAALRGKPVILHYWATWCEPCKQDMRRLRQLQARYQKAGLEIVGVSVDIHRSDAAAFLKENPLPWTQLFEEGGMESSRLANELGVQTLPTMLLIDKAGKVVQHNVQIAQLDEELDALTR